jgi:hypothetical protein
MFGQVVREDLDPRIARVRRAVQTIRPAAAPTPPAPARPGAPSPQPSRWAPPRWAGP